MGMLDIASVYPEISNSAKQDKTSMSMMGWEGLQNLAQNSLNYMNQNVRGGLFQATGREGVLSPEMMMGRAISAYSKNPTAPGADQTLLEATQKFAPERLPQLLQAMESKRVGDKQEGYADAAAARAEAEDARAAARDAREAEAERQRLERETAEEARRVWEHTQRVEQVDRIREYGRQTSARHLAMSQNPTFAQLYVDAGLTRDFLKTADPAVIEEALDQVQNMTAQEHQRWQQEREKFMAQLDDSNRWAIEDQAQSATKIFGDFVEQSDSLYLKQLHKTLEEFPTAQNYGNFMAEFGRQENQNRENLFDMMKIAAEAAARQNGGIVEPYATTEEEMDTATMAVLNRIAANKSLRTPEGDTIDLDNPNLKNERRESLSIFNSMIRNVLETASQLGYSPNSERVQSLAFKYATGDYSEVQLVAELTGKTVETPVSDGSERVVDLTDLLNQGGTGIPDVTTGFGNVGR